jgi:hypothetical protein
MLGEYFGSYSPWRISKSSLLALKNRGLVADSTERDANGGHFAHFHDPDGNEVTMWEGKQ